jgi:transcriptional regulator with XRE-family HTH domain
LGFTEVMQVNGEAIRVIREGKGVSLRALAAKAECSPSYLSRIERGQRGSRYIGDRELLARIAEHLGVTVAALTKDEAA